MKTIQIKVTIDGVSHFSKQVKLSQEDIQETADEIELAMKDGGAVNFENDFGMQMYFGSELIKKSIITIIEH